MNVEDFVSAERPQFRPGRRGFLIGLAAATGGAFALRLAPSEALAQGATTPPFRPLAASFIEINPDGTCTFRCAYAEMGQGVYTSLTGLIAEELDLDPAKFRVEQAGLGAQYRLGLNGNWRMTAGSTAIRWTGRFHREFGATARAMLIQAAAARWSVAPGSVTTEDGRLFHRASRRSLGYGDVAADAARLAVPATVTLKDPATFKYVGKPMKRLDTPAKIAGAAVFGIDVTVPGMVNAAVLHAPVFGAEPASFDPAPALAMRGVIAVERLPGAVAVVAEKYWQAKAALDRLAEDVRWTGHDNARFSSEAFAERARSRLDETGVPAQDTDEPAAVAQALAGAAKRIERIYRVPALAHAQIQPAAGVARWNGDALELWVENQGPDHFVAGLVRATGVAADKIEIRTPFVGGAYGRRLHPDLAIESALLARAVGRPVKVVWSREEEFKRDWYRPAHIAKLRAGIDAEGRLLAYHATSVGDGPGRWYFGFRDGQPRLDRSVTEGLQRQGYGAGVARVDYVEEHQPVQCGFWRAVASSQNGFFREAFMDEVAAEAGLDPVEFRRRNFAAAPRYAAVLETVARMAGYRSAAPYQAPDGTRRAMGVAVHMSYESIVGQIAEVSIADGAARVHRVWCAFDIGGQVVDPNGFRQQVEGGILMGMSAALYERLDFENGVVSVANFDGYRIATMADAPEIFIEAIETPAPQPGGAGEPGLPPIAPAIVNAVAKLIGRPIRSLPLASENLGRA
ncbi:MAG: molybdopterin-dependent oxidoreductase [Tagaea sp.]|nr:molybdopterin-dependent oxidoreductase [Tagaea sp.]